MYIVVGAYNYITDNITREKPTSPTKMASHTEHLSVKVNHFGNTNG